MHPLGLGMPTLQHILTSVPRSHQETQGHRTNIHLPFHFLNTLTFTPCCHPIGNSNSTRVRLHQVEKSRIITGCYNWVPKDTVQGVDSTKANRCLRWCVLKIKIRGGRFYKTMSFNLHLRRVLADSNNAFQHRFL